MAFIVRRPADRWEIRESYTTDAGPRARTLATFRVLSPEVLERAARAARLPFDRDRLLQAAKRAGVPLEQPRGSALATALLRGMAHGERVRPGLRGLLIDRMSPGPSVDESVADWIGASMQERGSALVDLLGLADRLPKPPKTGLRFPGLSPARLRA